MAGRGRSGYVRAADLALLWSRSGGLCCYPDCGVICVLEATDLDLSTTIGQGAHIEAASDAGPRANPLLTPQERNAYPNLILLCPTHHRLADARESTYTVDMLRDWKARGESTILTALAQAMTRITFVELETVTRALVNNTSQSSEGFSLVPPRDKMNRNGLTPETDRLFGIGLVQSKQVEEYVAVTGSVDRTFVGRLTSGFVSEYQQQVTEGLEGDALFAAMRVFSAQGKTELEYQCAGLAVLVYLFERCEVFEQ